jgi:Protein of unknown function (DUF3800)
MFKSYMDESDSGDDSLQAFVVAGFLGTGTECDRVERAWKELVKPIGEFHGKNFFKRHTDGTMAGRYKHVSVNDAESCAISLIALLRASQLEPVGMVLDSNSFMMLSEDERRWMTSAVNYGKSWPMQGSPSDPYFACYHYCLTSANEYTPEGELINLTFHRHEAREGNAKKMYNEIKDLGGKWGERLAETVLFSSQHDAVLLQAADLLAHSIGQAIKEEKKRNRITNIALEKLAFNRPYIRVMDVKSLDTHLQKCPFRRTFWEGCPSDPDFFEQLRIQGANVLAIRNPDGLYLTHHIKREKVRVIQELDALPILDLGARNLTDRQEDSTTNKRVSNENSVD